MTKREIKFRIVEIVDYEYSAGGVKPAKYWRIQFSEKQSYLFLWKRWTNWYDYCYSKYESYELALHVYNTVLYNHNPLPSEVTIVQVSDVRTYK